ncbi:hypothetical protein [Actibacterium sp. 188UL27-1]|uniref:hypothetical protein n=1 Tax=Actibacterium sp. 188UL27-1 TaxID=2786961 RepID=UPI00195AA252|nr:hypothetical protein [Actibacterium sp. 188UL27-1]MBM7068569.1 hypothetical protein [Actibacterium sp. 188UL27-1]
MTYTDDVLRSYLAGEVTAQQSADIEAAVIGDSALEARLLALDPMADRVRQAFAALPDPSRLAGIMDRAHVVGQSAPGAFPVFGKLSLVAASFVGLLVGLCLYGWFATTPSKAADWQEQVAAYQMLYVPATVAAITPSPDALTEQFKVAAALIDLDLEQGALSALPELTLKRAQVLGFRDAPLVQIAFSAPDGTPIAFCIYRPNDGLAQADLQMSELSGLRTAGWSTQTHGFLLIGGTDPGPIQDVGTHLFGLFKT